MPGTITIHSTQEEVLEEIKSNPSALRSANWNFKKDGFFILEAIAINPEVFKYADNSLRMDMDFAFLAYKRNPSVYIYTDINITGDKKYIRQREFMDLGGDPLDQPATLKEDYELGIVSESDYLDAPLGAHERERGQKNTNAREIVLDAIRKNPCALLFASDKLKNDMKFVSEAVDRDPRTLKYSGVDVIITFLEKDPSLFKFVKERFGQDNDFIYATIKRNPKLFDRSKHTGGRYEP